MYYQNKIRKTNPKLNLFVKEKGLNLKVLTGLSLLFMFLMTTVFAQNSSVYTPEFETYLALRQRLLERFVVVGAESGHSLPLAIDHPQFDRWGNISNRRSGDKGMIRWADGMIYLGDYLAVLATEYALFQKNGLETRETKRELYYALQAINRLDSLAEHIVDNIPLSNRQYEKNGFLIRDDVSENFVWQHYQRMAYQSDGNHIGKPENNYMSQDQVIGLLFGLALVNKFCDDENAQYKGFVFRQATQNITHRLVHYLWRCNWLIKHPITEKEVPRGANIMYQCYAIAKAGEVITGKKYQDWWSTSVSRLTWTLAQIPFPFLSKQQIYHPTEDKWKNLIYGDVNNSMMLRLASVSPTWGKRRLAKNAKAACMEIFMLVHALMYDYEPFLPANYFEYQIGSMTQKGSYSFDENNKAPGGWAATSRWMHPADACMGSYHKTHQNGDYPSLDYMLLFNVYHLVYDLPLKGE